MIASKLASRLSVLATLAALATGAPASADVCHQVDILVDNPKNTDIKALSIEYLFENDNVWRSEAFTNQVVDAFSTETVAFDQNLPGGEGNRLIGMKLHYKAMCGGHWSVEKTSVIDDTFDDESTCQSFSDRRYRIDLLAGDVCD